MGARYLQEQANIDEINRRQEAFTQRLREESKQHKAKKRRKKGKMSYLDMPNFFIFKEINDNFVFFDKTKFKAKSHNEDKQIFEYFSTMFFKFKPPVFIVNELITAVNNFSRHYNNEPKTLDDVHTCFIHLSLFDIYKKIANGESLKEDLKDYFNKKEIHLFTNSKQETMIKAAIEAKMSFLKIDRKIIDFVLSNDRILGRSFLIYTIPLINFIFKNKDLIEIAKFSEILDYIYTYAGRNNLEESVTEKLNRSYQRLVEESDEWHIEMMFMKNIKAYSWDPVFEDWEYIKSDEETFHITEITTTKRLSSEGRRMRHCVLSYAQRCARGSCSILSLSSSLNSLMLTIEVDKKSRKIVQVKGKSNRAPTNSELYLLDQFAIDNNLTLATYL